MEVLFLLPFLSPLFFCVHNTNALTALEIEKPYFEAIYQFGDSISDTGNLIREHYDRACAKAPYGQTFFHYPTGRCSDGLLMIDFFAKALNLPFLDPYLKEKGNFTHGVNFAVAGATALNSSILAPKNMSSAYTNSSLLVQLDWFKCYLNALQFDSTPSEWKKKFERALFLVEIGGNDYNFGALRGRTMGELQAWVPEVIETIMNVVKELIEVGAKRVIVPGNFPIGCIPIYLARFKTNDSTMYDEFNCLRSWNEFAVFHNDKLQQAIRVLQKMHPHVAIIYGDYYSALRSILKNAPHLGFEDSLLSACCGSVNDNYNIDFKKACGSKGVPVCSDPNKRLSWDGLHFTQRTYQLMATWLLLKDIIPSSVKVV